MRKDNSTFGVLLMFVLVIGLLILFALNKLFIYTIFCYLGYNTFFLLDNLLGMNPFNTVAIWGIWGLLIGSIFGVFVAAKKYKLNPVLILYPTAMVVLLFVIMGFVNKPTQFSGTYSSPALSQNIIAISNSISPDNTISSNNYQTPSSNTINESSQYNQPIAFGENTNTNTENNSFESTETPVNSTYITILKRTYFYDQPDINSKNKKYLVNGDKIFIIKSEGEFIYSSFTNPQGATTSGWLLKNDMQNVNQTISNTGFSKRGYQITSNEIPCYIINVFSVTDESLAIKKVKELKSKCFNAGYLWIPDFRSLSGARYFSVFIGPFSTQKKCEAETEEYRKIQPDAYGLLVSNESIRVEIRGIGKVKTIQQ